MAAGRLHDPTEHQLSQARRAGDVPRSGVLPLAVALLATCLLCVSHGGTLAEAGLAVFRLSLAGIAEGRPVGAVASEVASVAVGALLPVLVWFFVAAVVAVIAQPGGLIARRRGREDGHAMAAARLGVGGRLVRWVLAWSLAVVALGVGVLVSLSALRGVLAVPMGDLDFARRAASALLFEVLSWTAGATAVLAVLDLLAQRALHRSGLRMTDAERLEERRQTQLDPAVAGERRRRQQRFAGAADAVRIREADLVVVSRAGHLAAVRHRSAGDTPSHPVVTVSARGAGAQRLLLTAGAQGLSPVLDDGLAHALGALEPGAPVPRHLFGTLAAHLRESPAA